MQGVIKFFRANPQALVLLVICVVLGLGTFIAVLIALASSPNGQTTGDPEGVVLGTRAAWRRYTRRSPAFSAAARTSEASSYTARTCQERLAHRTNVRTAPALPGGISWRLRSIHRLRLGRAVPQP